MALRWQEIVIGLRYLPHPPNGTQIFILVFPSSSGLITKILGLFTP